MLLHLRVEFYADNSKIPISGPNLCHFPKPQSLAYMGEFYRFN